MALLDGAADYESLREPGERPSAGAPLRRNGVAVAVGITTAIVFVAAGLFYTKSPQAPTTAILTEEHAPEFLGLWEYEGPSPKERQHEVTFVVKQNNDQLLEDLIYERADPDSPHFRQWLTHSEVLRLTRNEESLRTVHEFLGTHEPHVSVVAESGGLFVRARAATDFWEEFFGSELGLYRHHDGRPERRARAASYTLPTPLHGHVVGVLNWLDTGNDLPWNATGPATKPLELLSIDELVTPPKLRSYYKMPPVAEAGSPEAEARSKTTQMVYASLKQYWSPADRKKFEQYFGLPDHGITEEDTHGEHGKDYKCRTDPNSCGEANLDVQYMVAMSPWAQTAFWYMPSTKNFEEFLEEIADLAEPPQVISISYGGVEAGRSSSLIQAFNAVAKQLSLTGTTILASSGDDGANGVAPFIQGSASCSAILSAYGLQVNWPAASPWVTAVGATMGVESNMPEIACSTNARGPTASASYGLPGISSGGGYSQQISKPHWQDGVSGDKRGVPDISMAGHGFATVIGGGWQVLDGTSASSPTAAGMISLINAMLDANVKPEAERRMKAEQTSGASPLQQEAEYCPTHTGGTCAFFKCFAWRGPTVCSNYDCICEPGYCSVEGKCVSKSDEPPPSGGEEPPSEETRAGKSVGFINPLLYRHPEAFNDIVHGNNKCTRKTTECCGGYDAGPGWDAVTGLGSPDFEKLSEVLLAKEESP